MRADGLTAMSLAMSTRELGSPVQVPDSEEEA